MTLTQLTAKSCEQSLKGLIAQHHTHKGARLLYSTPTVVRKLLHQGYNANWLMNDYKLVRMVQNRHCFIADLWAAGLKF